MYQEDNMRKKEYAKPCFECIMLLDEEIGTADFFGASVDNDLPWNNIFYKPNQSNNNNDIII